MPGQVKVHTFQFVVLPEDVGNKIDVSIVFNTLLMMVVDKAWKDKRFVCPFGLKIGRLDFFFFFHKSGRRRNAKLFMCVNSWACRASELVWSWCKKGVVFPYIWLKYLLRTFTIYSDILFWTFLFKKTKTNLSIKKKKKKKKEPIPCFPIFWVGWKRANKQFVFFDF